jgi:hypothetical protein
VIAATYYTGEIHTSRKEWTKAAEGYEAVAATGSHQ